MNYGGYDAKSRVDCCIGHSITMNRKKGGLSEPLSVALDMQESRQALRDVWLIHIRRQL